MSSSTPLTPSDDDVAVSSPRLVASSRNRGGRSRLRRRVSGMLVLVMALLGAGFLATALTPNAQVAVAQDDPTLVRQGKELYANACITCHGANLQGVQDRGPSLIGVGEAAVYFQVSSGRMPAVRNEAQAARKPAKFTAAETDQLGAYIQANGGGPTVPRNADGSIASTSLVGSDVARGSQLFRLNCASCHNFTGRGGALSSGKYAPNLDQATEAQIYTAMTSGPQNMPKFSDRQLSVEEKGDIIAYVNAATQDSAPGGYSLGGLGPVSEGLFIWIVGIVALVGATLWVGAKA
jgi:ubiquinol-cytochrome c reductase cytochrome c subunit